MAPELEDLNFVGFIKMQAFLYKLMFYNQATKYPDEIEFIVASPNADARDSEIIRIKEWYQQNFEKPFDKVCLSSSLAIEALLYSEHHQTSVDWIKMQIRVQDQSKTRPRGVGCIFRGPLKETDVLYETDEIQELKESIQYLMDEHRVEGKPFVFVGSTWDSKSRLRTNKASLFEASSIQLAADLVELHHLGPKAETTLTEWCCPIYVV